jgi:hypothetical protein
MLIERGDRARAPAVASAAPIDVGDHHRLPALRRRRDLGRLAHLALAVAVDLGDCDLREVMALEERQQVVRQIVSVVVGRVRLDLQLLGGEPVGRKLVEGRIDLRHRGRIRPLRPPGAEVDVAQHDRQLALGHLHRPPILGAPELDYLALAEGAEAQREAAPAAVGREHLSARARCHQLSRGADIGLSMKALRSHGMPGRWSDAGERATFRLLVAECLAVGLWPGLREP